MADDTRLTLAAPGGAVKRRRPHSAAFKRQVLEACAVPGASVAAVALSFGLNANLVQTWRRRARDRHAMTPAAATPAAHQAPAAAAPAATAAAQFIPLALAAPKVNAAAGAPATDISIEVKRGAASISVRWPVAAAAECAGWLRDLLR